MRPNHPLFVHYSVGYACYAYASGRFGVAREAFQWLRGRPVAHFFRPFFILEMSGLFNHIIRNNFVENFHGENKNLAKDGQIEFVLKSTTEIPKCVHRSKHANSEILTHYSLL